MRRTALLLSAILIPTAAVVLLVVRVVRQENELAERRMAAEQREALDQLRRELTARLQALRLEEVNRLIGESGRRLPPDSPIVFVAPMVQDRMVLPWEDSRTAPLPQRSSSRWQPEGEAREFQRHDAAAAAAAYRQALDVARSPLETVLRASLAWPQLLEGRDDGREPPQRSRDGGGVRRSVRRRRRPAGALCGATAARSRCARWPCL